MDTLASTRKLRHGVAVFGLLTNEPRDRGGRILEGEAYIKIDSSLDVQRLIQRPNELARLFSDGPAHALAFVAIGFGRAPVSRFDRSLWKGDFDETKHPRVPEGCPEGGEFCNADEASESNDANQLTDGTINQNQIIKDLVKNLTRREARDLLRNRLVAALRGVAGAIADLVPGAGEAFDVYELGQAVADTARYREEVVAAEACVRAGPKTLEELRASLEDRSFPTDDAFKKLALEKVYGAAGPGQDWHHIVWQGGANGRTIPAELLHSTENMIRVPRLLHEEITDAYRDTYDGTGKSLRDWLDTQPYEVQRAEGLKVMRRLGIIK